MYLLDTNVISELRKSSTGKANSNVTAWTKSVGTNQLFISSITVFELEQGVLRMERKDPHQGQILRSWLNNRVLPSFAERILPFDTLIAFHAAKMHIPNPRSDRDSFIAATAKAHGLTMVTRDYKDFKDISINLLNPWEFQA